MFTVKYMLQAIDDLGHILDYIAKDNPPRAISFVDELELKTNAFLSTAPLGGTTLKNQTRYFPIGNYIVLYEVEESTSVVNVLHIANARTDWKKQKSR